MITFLKNQIAYLDMAEPWQLGFQDPATPVMEGIINFHHDLVFFLIIVTVFVCWLLYRVIFLFDEKKNPIASTFVQGPPAILLIIAVSSFALLYSMDEIIDSTCLCMSDEVNGENSNEMRRILLGNRNPNLINTGLDLDTAELTAGLSQEELEFFQKSSQIQKKFDQENSRIMQLPAFFPNNIEGRDLIKQKAQIINELIYLEKVLKLAYENDLLKDFHLKKCWFSLKSSHLLKSCYIEYIFDRKNEDVHYLPFVTQNDLSILEQIKNKHVELQLKAEKLCE